MGYRALKRLWKYFEVPGYTNMTALCWLSHNPVLLAEFSFDPSKSASAVPFEIIASPCGHIPDTLVVRTARLPACFGATTALRNSDRRRRHVGILWAAMAAVVTIMTRFVLSFVFRKQFVSIRLINRRRR